jgi:hypothetical protein
VSLSEAVTIFQQTPDLARRPKLFLDMLCRFLRSIATENERFTLQRGSEKRIN